MPITIPPAANPELSLVIPCYNEAGNLRELIKAIRASVDPLNLPYEVVITDDCSRDQSWAILKEFAAADPRIRVQKFAFNCGESAASFAGLKAARGKFLFTLDADLQNDPMDDTQDRAKLANAQQEVSQYEGQKTAAESKLDDAKQHLESVQAEIKQSGFIEPESRR